MNPSKFLACISLVTIVVSSLVACANKKSNLILLMPAPEVYEAGSIDPFIDNDPISRGVQPGVFYATDRAPAMPDDNKHDYYSDQRGNVLRLGMGRIELGVDESISWEEARRISLLKNRTEAYPLQVTSVEEFGPLAQTVRPFDDGVQRSPEPGRRFAANINRQLATSEIKDVYIYVHGYKVTFENPLLVASELWHFLGYNGAFIAYAWPSTPKTLAYWSDLEDAANSARGLRSLILFVAKNTTVNKIHVIGYSAGTRVVSRMLADLGMYGYLMEEEEVEERVKLGNVILIGSDVDRAVLAGYLLDGALRIPDALTIYLSSADKALDMSRLVFGKDRVGQLLSGEPVGANAARFFEAHSHLRIIDVTNAEGSDSGNGHSYFRSSPWVSSDVLMTLHYDLAPEDRGLVQTRESGIRLWRFPSDYINRLRNALTKANPSLTADSASSP